MRTAVKGVVFSSLVFMLMGLVLFVVACVVWAAFFDRPFLTYTNLPFTARAAVHAGESVELHVARCNRSKHQRTYLTLLPDVWIDIAPGCTESVSRANEVPLDTAPGLYLATGVAVVPGLVRDHRVTWASHPFEVLPAKSAKEK
jgi:hypothetical protein